MSEPAEVREPDQLDGVPPPEHQPAVVGHAEAIDGVRALLEGGRLPGGILIHGPLGIGKATLAFAMAREIFARTGDESPELVSEQVAAGAYPNLRVLRRPRATPAKGSTPSSASMRSAI